MQVSFLSEVFMRSMTAFAEIHHPLNQGHLRLFLRSVNSKALELNIRLHPALFPLEGQIRTLVREKASRGKLDLTVELQDEPSLEPQMNRALLKSVAKAWQEDAEWLELPPMSADAFFRMPQAWLMPKGDVADRVEGPLTDAVQKLLDLWNEGRSREADRLKPFFTNALEQLFSLHDQLQQEAKAQAQELPQHYLQKLEQLLKDAQVQGQVAAERVLAEAAILSERQDVQEELVRLKAHLDDFQGRLKRDQVAGKALDVWCQEVLRELNTCSSKCKRLSMTRAVMEAKGVLDQIREQGMNLE